MNDPQPAATVVVPTHHGAHRLPVLLEALTRQERPGPWELVVVIDGDDTAVEQLLAEWTDRLPLRVVRRHFSTGVAGALNAGYTAARGEIVIRCDDDLTPGPHMVRRHVEHHRGAERLGVIGPTRDIIPDSPYSRAYGRAATDRAVSAVLSREAGELWRHWAAHNSIRRADVAAIGGFDESFSYREDSDLGLRLTRSGVRLVVDPDLEIEHRGAAGDARTRVARAWISGASEVLFERRHPDVSATPASVAARSLVGRGWSAATKLVALGLPTRASADRAGSWMDRILPVVAPRLGGRLVALLVESAARAGRARGSADQRTYREQKSAELDRECRRRT